MDDRTRQQGRKESQRQRHYDKQGRPTRSESVADREMRLIMENAASAAVMQDAFELVAHYPDGAYDCIKHR